MNQAVTEWPANYPQNVPPQESSPANGQSYRLVCHNPPLRADFATSREDGLCLREPYTELEFVCSYGTSQFWKLEDIKKTRRLFPKLRKKLIAIGELTPSCGNMLNTFRPSHHTVWYKITAQPQNNFSVLDGV
ncbi:hypothetical protein tinsulaeT_25300 [Thalassotalea insulae]|uniref:Uncharacterized protein n=1 Tax=Thalassotalea insulae TaxID=2056778 RepID=A0ABQ6GWT4_9GAMM|nr:hypothetical protein [Thalassotalea insulae]GLX79190.1 hypothetical protein tinsulaeT_25300 [Thalassotalea insulae]